MTLVNWEETYWRAYVRLIGSVQSWSSPFTRKLIVGALLVNALVFFFTSASFHYQFIARVSVRVPCDWKGPHSRLVCLFVCFWASPLVLLEKKQI